MKFVSKNSNLLVVISPGIPAQPLSGTPAKSGIYVKFQDGIADVKDEEIAKKMLVHAGFNSDFIVAEDKDPYIDYRQEKEPGHSISEIKYGHVENTMSSPKKPSLTPEMNALINQLAMQKVQEMIPTIVEATLKSANLKATEVVSPEKEETEEGSDLVKGQEGDKAPSKGTRTKTKKTE